MAQATNKITEFPGIADPAKPIAALPAGFLTQDRDPTREIRNLIDELQSTAGESRRRQQLAEEERDQLRGKLLALQQKLDSAPQQAAQIKTLTRERDTLIEQQSLHGRAITELKQRLKLAEDALRTAGSERDAAARDRKHAQRLLDESEKRIAEAARQNDAAIRQRDQIKEERDQAQRNFAAAQKTVAEARQELAATRKKGEGELAAQLDSIRQARDGMADQIGQLKQRITSLEDELAETAYARETAEKTAPDSKGMAELQNRVDAAEEKNRILSENEARLASEISAMRDEMDASLQDSAGRVGLLDETRASLVATQQQIEGIICDRDSLKAQLEESAAAFEARIGEQAGEIAHLTQALNSNEGRVSERHEMEAHFEKRRLDMIELNTKLENAHREIRNLSASLAEARLHAKLSGHPLHSGGIAASESRNAAAKDSAQPADGIVAMRRSFQAFSRDQKQIGPLAELETYTLTIASRAMHDGHTILHHVCTAFASLLSDLLEVPDQITPSTLRTLNQGIEFIALLLSDPEIENVVRLNEVRAFVVDDDANTGSTMVAALNLVGINGVQALSSSVAIAELASNSYDLILLDVHMPDLDGFELSAQIRNMGQHAETPIFFVTGDTSIENRVKSSLRGAIEFIAKPFNVQELALKSLKSVITGQLRDR